jgi:hypothetical protein
VPIERWGSLLQFDCAPDFDIISFSYDGSDFPEGYFPVIPRAHLKSQTEFYGETFRLLMIWVSMREDSEWGRVCVLNGDVITKVSDLNNLFLVSDVYDLDASQASLTWDSYWSHAHLLHKPGILVEKVDFIELMAPVLSMRLIRSMVELNMWTISSWGIDACVVPYLIRRNSLTAPAVVHSSLMHHCKPVESGNKIYSNGLTAQQELAILERKLMAI